MTASTFIVALGAIAVPLGQTAPWWGGKTAGLIGAIGGSTLGLTGGILGTLAGTGRGLRFVLRFVPILIALGVLCASAGAVALLLGQPYAVYYPLLLLGGVTAGVCGGLFPVLRRRFRQIELRKVQALDTR